MVLVRLTDGRDYGSRFEHQTVRAGGASAGSAALCDRAQQPRLPAQFLAAKQQKPLPPDANLETLSMEQAGACSTWPGAEDLANVYATINAELRSQYLLAF